MNDRELLELAAKAALGRTSIPGHVAQMIAKGWNPLEDDGDAQRLMVRMQMTVSRRTGSAVAAIYGQYGEIEVIENFIAEDVGEHIGTRRAIVRAAAEIGRQME